MQKREGDEVKREGKETRERRRVTEREKKALAPLSYKYDRSLLSLSFGSSKSESAW